MFHTLHQLYVVGWASLSILAVAWIYPRSGISEPLLDWYAVWQNKPGPVLRPVAELSGTAVRVIDGSSFTLQASDRQFYNVALLGITAPALTPKATRTALALAEASKAQLSELILSNRVEVTFTFLDAQRRGVGVVHRGELNVNAAMVESGLVKLKRQHITGLPWRDQYALLKADRESKTPKAAPQEPAFDPANPPVQ